MKTVDLDLHNFTVKQAILAVERLLYSYYHTPQKNDPESLKVVTGNGEIRTAVMDYLDSHGYEWHPEGNNAGCFIIFL